MTAPAQAVSPAPQVPQVDVTLTGGGEWGDRRWQNDDWRWRHRYHSRYRHGDPGFSFHFGPFPQFGVYFDRPRRDCYRTWDGRLYCRAY
jgi:hypothetical protein